MSGLSPCLGAEVVKSLMHTLKQISKIIHPDLFHAWPEYQKINQTSLSILNGIYKQKSLVDADVELQLIVKANPLKMIKFKLYKDSLDRSLDNLLRKLEQLPSKKVNKERFSTEYEKYLKTNNV